MTDLFKFIESNFEGLFAFCVAWVIGGYFIIYLFYRKNGQQLPEIPPEKIIFSESSASGASHKTLFSRFGGASRILRISIGDGHLKIKVPMPFALVDFVSGSRLQKYIPIRNIRKTAAKGRRGVLLEFIDMNGSMETIELILKKRDDFINCIAQAKNL